MVYTCFLKKFIILFKSRKESGTEIGNSLEFDFVVLDNPKTIERLGLLSQPLSVLNLFHLYFLSQIHGMVSDSGIVGNNIDEIDPSLRRTFSLVETGNVGLAQAAF